MSSAAHVYIPDELKVKIAEIYATKDGDDRTRRGWQSEFDAIYASDRFMVLTVHPRSGWGSRRRPGSGP